VEFKFAIEEMKKAREKWLIIGRREKEEQEYHHKRKESHKIIRNKKKTYVENVIESIEEDQKHNNTRKMYQTVNQLKKGYQHKFSTIRNKKGVLAMNTKEKAEIWKEYYKAVTCIYLYIHTVMNTTILQLVAIYYIQLHVSALYVGHIRLSKELTNYTICVVILEGG